MTDDHDDVKKVEEQKRKPIPGLGLRYHSRHVTADISIPQGILRKAARWIWAQKMYIYNGAIWVALGAAALGGISLRDIAKINTQDVQALEVKINNYDEKVIKLEQKVAVLEIISNEDGRELEKAQKLEKNRKRRKELEDYNKARAEKLKKISQTDELRANPQAPKTTIFSPTKN